jgi:hypothetical protein
MFEALFGDLITRFLGHFLDVRTEQLRVSLWSGMRNVDIRYQLLLPYTARYEISSCKSQQ